MTKRGKPTTLTPSVEADMERLWCHTAIPRQEIAARVNAAHGTTLSADQIEWHAGRRGWSREMMIKSLNHPATEFDRIASRSLARWGFVPRIESPVRRVEPGTFRVPERGYRVGRG